MVAGHQGSVQLLIPLLPVTIGGQGARMLSNSLLSTAVAGCWCYFQQQQQHNSHQHQRQHANCTATLDCSNAKETAC